MMRVFLTIISISFLSSFALADDKIESPFGVYKGMPLSELDIIEEVEIGKYKVKITKPDEDFKIYHVKATEETGVCYVSSTTDVINTDANGVLLKQKFNDIASRLNTKYEEWMFSLDNNNEPETSWMNGLLSKNRDLKKVWYIKRDTLSDATLVAKAATETEGWIELEFMFDNYPNCFGIIEKEVGAI